MNRILLVVTILAAPAMAAGQSLPPSTSPQFCVAVQQQISSTSMVGENEVFADMPPYRHSKPSIDPLKIYQVVTYAGNVPVVVSCKMKTAAHLRAIHGSAAAGAQKFCPDIAELVRAQAVAELRGEGEAAAADRAAAFVIDQVEPYITGRDYLSDFRATFVGEDGAIHVNAPGLFQDYDRWYTIFLPEIVRGQSYCHLATVESLKAIASGAMKPGATITTRDDAPTQPQRPH